MKGVCPLQVTEQEMKQLTAATAVCLCEWENSRGERWSKLLMIGSLEECQEECDTVQAVIVPVGVKCIGKQVVKVADLMPPDEKPT